MTLPRQTPTISKALVALTTAMILVISAQTSHAFQIKWVNVTPKLPGQQAYPPSTSRQSIGPAGRQAEGLPAADTNGGRVSDNAQTRGWGRRPAVPLSPNSTGQGTTNIGDAFVNAWINLDQGARQSTGLPTAGSIPSAGSNRGSPTNTGPPNTGNALFQILNDRMIADRARSSSSTSIPTRSAWRDSVPPPPPTFIRLGVTGLQLPNGGFQLTTVSTGGRGANLGLEPGDIIEQVNGRVVRSVQDITRAINSPSGNALFLIRNVRDGRGYHVPFNA